MAKIERKYLAHYLDAKPNNTTPEWVRLGKDLEELSVELSPATETKTNILGETSTTVSSYEVSASVEPFYADMGDALFDLLQGIIDDRKTLDDCKTSYLEVQTWNGTGGSYVAYKETAVLEVTSYGGDTTGYAIPFTIHPQGDRVKGTFNPTTKTFTAGTAPARGESVDE